MHKHSMFSLYNVTCMFVLGLIIWYWVTIGVFLPRRDYFCQSQHSIVAHSLLSKAKAFWALPSSTLGCLLALFFGLCLHSHAGENPWLYLLKFPGDTISQQAPCFSDS